MQARENARQVREQISSEMWEQLNRLFLEVRRMGTADVWDAQPLDFLSRQGKLAPVSGHHRFHHEPRRRLAVHPGRPLIWSAPRPPPRCWTSHFREFLSTECSQASDSTRAHGMDRACCEAAPRLKLIARSTRPICRPERIAEFLLLNSEFPHSIRFAVDQIAAIARSHPREHRQQAVGPRGEARGPLCARS